MLKREDIDNLATLARIALSEEEKEAFPEQLDAILSYVSEIGTVATIEDTTPRAGELRNVMRPDSDAHEGGEYTDTILKNAPQHEDGYLKVQQIF